MGIPDHLICLLRNVYAGQQATVRTGHGTMDWFKIGKGVRQGYMLSPCLLNFYAEYITGNVKLDLEKAEEPEIKLPTSVVTLKKQENSRKTSTFGSLTMLKPFDCVDHNKLENSPSDGNSRPPYLPPAKPVCRSRSYS